MSICLSSKNTLRSLFREKRKAIGLKRRIFAERKGQKKLCLIAEPCKKVLSYASFQDEFCTKKINQYLAYLGKLVLPKVEGCFLELYLVKNMNNDLIKNSWGIWEPNPSVCEKISPEAVDVVFVPAIAFDKNCQRIGYGKGFYDRLLPFFPKKTVTYGVGFLEQFSTPSIPTQVGDYPLKKLLLF